MKGTILAMLLVFSVFSYKEQVAQLPTKQEFHCLVKNVYYEARGESKLGKEAVAIVTLNRVRHPDYPKSICGVVYQKKQFSWTIKPSKAKINAKDWQDSINAAVIAYNSKGFEATHYHNFTVRPNWGLKRVAVIGNHIFYI
jgi:spore germination cell wall hydrolase CwlJ-like protein